MVFAMGGDPVKLGSFASLNRPGGNVTGVAFLVNGLAAKQVELLHQLAPKAAVMGFLVNPKDPNAEGDINDAQAAAAALGHKLVLGKASTEGEIDSTFITFGQQGIAALFVDAEPFLLDQRKKIIALATQQAIPVVSQFRCSPLTAPSRPMARVLPKQIACLVCTPVGFLRGPSPPTCRSCSRLNSIWY
jgi:putative ABC transport system substrate-binding protein